MLPHMEGIAGGPPIPAPCNSGPAVLGMPAVSRKSASPALHEHHTLFGAGAGVSRSQLTVKPVCAVP